MHAFNRQDGRTDKKAFAIPCVTLHAVEQWSISQIFRSIRKTKTLDLICRRLTAERANVKERYAYFVQPMD